MAAPPLGPALAPAPEPPILVAIDDDATPALEYAAQAARRARCGLHLLHVVPPGSPAAAREGEALLRKAAARAADLTGGSAPVTTELAHADPVADVLVQRASAARQLVLQCRHGDSGGTCSRVVCRTACPVVLVPSRDRAGTRAAGHAASRGGLLEDLRVFPALPETLP